LCSSICNRISREKWTVAMARSRSFASKEGSSDPSEEGAQWTKQQAGSLFYIALSTIERRPKMILAHPA
jgi:hypothetical protein